MKPRGQRGVPERRRQFQSLALENDWLPRRDVPVTVDGSVDVATGMLLARGQERREFGKVEYQNRRERVAARGCHPLRLLLPYLVDRLERALCRTLGVLE